MLDEGRLKRSGRGGGGRGGTGGTVRGVHRRNIGRGLNMGSKK